MDRTLDIVLPCYNPSSGWEEKVLDSIREIRRKIDGVVHLTLVNDGSSIELAPAIKKLEETLTDFTYIHQVPNGGKGKALRTGIRSTLSDRIIFTDIDFPYTTDSLLEIFHHLVDYDVVIGIRDASYYDNIPFRRKWISKILKQVNKILLRLPSADTQGGLKGMNEKGRAVFLETGIDRYLIDLDFLKRVGKRKLRFKECVVQLKKGIEVSEMGYRILIDELSNFIQILFR